MPTDYQRPLCPACRNPLKHSIEFGHGGKAEHMVYCGVGRRPSTVANEPHRGATLELAMKHLEQAIEQEEIKDES